MSSFASRNQKTIPNPFEPPQTFTIRKLSGAAVDEAQAKHVDALISGRNPRGWAAKFQRLLEHGQATDADAIKALTDPLAGYDRLLVAQRGLVGWSYTRAPDGTPLPVTEQAIADLDDETLEHVALEIMRLTKPALFLTPEDAEAARKNGSGPSSSTSRDEAPSLSSTT